jgi:hypothetical protein
LRGPDHWWQVKAQSRVVESKLLPVLAIVGHRMTTTMHAYQKLMQCSVRVFAPDLFARDAEHQKVTLHVKRYVLADFAGTQQPAKFLEE